MVHLFPTGPKLDAAFAVLADPTRRGIVEELGTRGELSITWIADRFGISVTGARKHVRVLEEAELVSSVKRGRTRRCALTGQPLNGPWVWLEEYRDMLNERLDRLDELLAETVD
ncbi:MAG TPA: metalloregulator ArsR/SmtB family transcription factor [Solirubrobacteraceae bacterium]|nr:metalloregulator ArsR/SmtB family transcription factor [Solirubrobacteraceae bacterium]